MHSVTMDMMTNLPPASGTNHNQAVVLVDRFTKKVFAFSMPGTATAIVDVDAALSILQVQDEAAFNATGNLSLTGNSVFEGGTMLTVGGMLDLADGAMLDLQGTDLDAMNLAATGGIMVNSGATLMANANVDTSELSGSGLAAEKSRRLALLDDMRDQGRDDHERQR